MFTYYLPPLTIMVRFVGQSATMCPKPKHLKHFLLEVLVSDLGFEVEGLKSLDLEMDSFLKLKGKVKEDLCLFVQDEW